MEKVILSGGCFQNAYLTERTIDILQSKNYKVYWHQRVPPNDGGIALGQIAAYLFSQNAPGKTKKEKLINEVK
jgi:hydrogenase maturation protein HypF